jgi:hypothetical protein
MFAAGAVLGPLCDGLHSSQNVLHYHQPVVLTIGSWSLETCWWVPGLFGVAGLILGIGPILDERLAALPHARTGHSTKTMEQPSSSGPAGMMQASTALV